MKRLNKCHNTEIISNREKKRSGHLITIRCVYHNKTIVEYKKRTDVHLKRPRYCRFKLDHYGHKTEAIRHRMNEMLRRYCGNIRISESWKIGENVGPFLPFGEFEGRAVQISKTGREVQQLDGID